MTLTAIPITSNIEKVHKYPSIKKAQNSTKYSTKREKSFPLRIFKEEALLCISSTSSNKPVISLNTNIFIHFHRHLVPVRTTDTSLYLVPLIQLTKH